MWLIVEHEYSWNLRKQGTWPTRVKREVNYHVIPHAERKNSLRTWSSCLLLLSTSYANFIVDSYYFMPKKRKTKLCPLSWYNIAYQISSSRHVVLNGVINLECTFFIVHYDAHISIYKSKYKSFSHNHNITKGTSIVNLA